MINPNRVHRARAVVTALPKGYFAPYEVRVVKTGGKVLGYDLPKGIKLWDEVNIQASYSITLEAYVIRTIRKVPLKKSKVFSPGTGTPPRMRVVSTDGSGRGEEA